MWKAAWHGLLAAFATILQISFFSQLSFPLSTLSFPIIAIAYGIVRDRPLVSMGWALIAGILLDLHGLLGFGAETAALFISFFAARFLFRRVVTNTGALALFLLGGATAVIHWFVLSAIDGASVLFGSVPIFVDPSAAAVLAPLRQALVAGTALVIVVGAGDAARRRFRKTFLSHAPHAFS